jgi:hypothetical protein
MKEYDILEETDKYTLLRMINERAKDNWHLINFCVIKGTSSYSSTVTYYAILEREIDDNPSSR